MKRFSFVILVLCAIIKLSENYEQFDEKAWMERYELNKYFDYSDEKFQKHQTTTKSPPTRRSYKNQNLNIVDIILNAVRKVAKPAPMRSRNETSKGLDIQFETTNPDLIPTFGNNQDLQFIYLGTKWCGSGDIAKDKGDIGYFYLTDSCCRGHDLCQMAIEPQQSKFGLKNTGKFTRSHCDCDHEFYRCLKSVNTLVSKQIGIFYFNVLGPQCFTEDHPLKCTKKSRKRCVSYVVADRDQPKMYQWFDNKWF